MTARIVVIIPNQNGVELLPDCLNALSNQTRIPDRIVVVDNDSTDGSRDFLRSSWQDVELLECDRNLGFAGAVQRGIDATREPLIALLNNDARPDPDWLEHLSSCFTRPEVGSASSLMYTPSGTIESAGIGLSRAGVGYRIMEGDDPRGIPAHNLEVFGASGGAMMVRRDALEYTGGFDASFFAQDEDIDLAFRLRYAGFSSVAATSARVLHLGGQTLGRDPGRSLMLAQRNLEWAFWLNIPVWAWIVWGPFHLLYQGISLIRHAFRGTGSLVWAAKRDAFVALPHLIRKRKRPAGFISFIVPWIGRRYRIIHTGENQ